MGEKIVIGPISKGLKTDREPFVIDNDSFPTLINAYSWRGRLKRKRGTQLLGRLQRYFNSNSTSYAPSSTFSLLDGEGNLFVGFDLQEDGNIIPTTVTLVSGGNTYTDPSGDGILVGAPSGSGTINYATGDITIAGGGSDTVTAIFRYYPDLPVMGLRDFVSTTTQFPTTLGFDTVYSYFISSSFPYPIYDVSFYKNPASTTINGISYTQKTVVTPTSWNGQNYQQFWTVNYQGALWATNGITMPFDPTDVGMQFQIPSSATWVSATNMTFVIADPCPLVIGDWVFTNEFTSVTPANADTLNLQTGFVTASSSSMGSTTITVRFPYANIANDTYTPGILQYLTNRSDPTKDCLRWYDGDPTNGSQSSPSLTGHLGWVNFAPPINNLTLFPQYSVADLPPAQYYLIGARIIVPFKDRLLFFGPVIQTSSASSQVYLKDIVIYSQNGSPYYTASFDGDPTLADTIFHSLLVPTNQSASPESYSGDITGFGGFVSVGVDQAINTVSINEDVLIVGLDRLNTRMVYSGNDVIPFNFFIINSELGSGSTFSAINMDKGVITRGSRGFIITSQVETRRIDLDILDQNFQINLLNNGAERITSQRDYISEWIYFTYPSRDFPYSFPNQTLQYNYREDSWAIFNECYTTYGTFRKQSGFTWATVGLIYPTWNDWNAPWNASQSTLLNPQVIGGNQQGFILIRDQGTTSEGNSLYIQSFTNSVVTSPDHCLNEGDYIIISGCLGTVGTEVNDKIFSVTSPTTDTFILNPAISTGLTYTGGGLIKRMYVPYIQSKQFPVSWAMGRKTRLGPQQYLFSTTANGQITLLIFLSQNSVGLGSQTSASNLGPIVPDPNSINNTLVYSTVLYTCPESTNLGLTPANVNLQMPTALQQQQIWHRMNTSLLGDTVQVGFTLNDGQMRDTDMNSQFAEIEIHAMILDVSPSSLLA